MKVDPNELSRLRAWAVNLPAFMALSVAERSRIRRLIGADPERWTPEAQEYVEAGRSRFG